MSARDAYEMRESVGQKTIKKHQLSIAEVEAIIDAYKTGKRTQSEVACAFGVSSRLVSSLVVAARKDPSFVVTTRKRETKKREKLRTVIEKSCELLMSKAGCLRTIDIKDQVEKETDVKVSQEYVRQVLRCDIGAKYARIKKIPFLGNSDRCMLLR